MRDAQKNYFRARRAQDSTQADHWLIVSKRLEREVDAIIDSHQKEKVQPKLF